MPICNNKKKYARIKTVRPEKVLFLPNQYFQIACLYPEIIIQLFSEFRSVEQMSGSLLGISPVQYYFCYFAQQ